MVNQEQKEAVCEKVKALNDTIKELDKMAPEAAILPVIQEMMDSEEMMESLDNLLKDKEEEEQEAFINMITGALERMHTDYERFKKSLYSRIQPPGVPRKTREFKGFRKRRGSW
jgi:hypothetical protein